MKLWLRYNRTRERDICEGICVHNSPNMQDSGIETTLENDRFQCREKRYPQTIAQLLQIQLPSPGMESFGTLTNDAVSVSSSCPIVCR